MLSIPNLTKLIVSLNFILFIGTLCPVAAQKWFHKKCSHPKRACLKDGTVIPNLYVYNEDDFRNYLKKINPEYTFKFIEKIQSKVSGTAIYLKEFSGQRDFMIFANGKIKVLERPATGRFILNNDGEFREIHFQEKLAPNLFQIASDSTGTYFLLGTSKEDKIEIRGMADPDKLLARTNLRGRLQIFCIEDKVYLFGNDDTTYSKKGSYTGIVCQIFQKGDDGLELAQEIRIPRPQSGPTPFYAEDIDPSTKSVFLVDGRDAPGRSKYWLYSLKSKTLAQIYFSDDGWYPIFLKEDILGIAK